MRWFLVVVALGACASPPAAAPAPTRTAPIFEFHSDPWVNLHQRLIAEATAKPYWHVPVPIPPLSQAPEWSAAVAGYKTLFDGGKSVFDASHHRMNLTFALTSGATLPKERVEPDFAKLIEPAYGEYMRLQWPIDQARNEKWIASAEPLAARWAPEIAAELANRFEITWPARPIRVEVTQFAGFGGAFTSGDPIMTVMSSDDSGYVGSGVLEMLFHEASHGIDSILTHDLQMAFVAKGKREPQGLDHAIIFYTAGELVRRRFPGYVPYAYREGVWKRGWEKLEIAVRTHWQPWLDDRIDLETALSRLVDAFPE
jgi:hypothetical protein